MLCRGRRSQRQVLPGRMLSSRSVNPGEPHLETGSSGTRPLRGDGLPLSVQRTRGEERRPQAAPAPGEALAVTPMVGSKAGLRGDLTLPPTLKIFTDNSHFVCRCRLAGREP